MLLISIIFYNKINRIYLRFCIKNFLPDKIFKELDKLINDGTYSTYHYTNLNKQQEIKLLLLPYIYKFTDYLNNTLKTPDNKPINFKYCLTAATDPLAVMLINVTDTKDTSAKDWHQDLSNNNFNYDDNGNAYGIRNIVVPLSEPIIHTRIPFDPSDCDSSSNGEKRRDFFTCKEMNRGSASYFDAKLCHRGLNLIEITNLKNRIALIFQIYVKEPSPFTIEDEKQAVTKYNANTITTGGKLIRKSLDTCTIAELKERAHRRKINVSGLKKADIIAKLRK